MTGATPAGSGSQAAPEAAKASSPSVPIPSALERSWPIPLSRDAEGLFCDLAEEGAQTGLLALMTGISEEYWCAGWMSDLEYALWLARETGPRGYGTGIITERQCALLRLLSEEANGWWYWTEYGARFARLETWRAHASAIEARRAETRSGSVHESAVAESETPNLSPSSITLTKGQDV